MRIEEYIAESFARRVEMTVIARARHSLRQLGNSTMLSGDDSPLLNIWDEICAQQQGEESFYWSAYEEVIDQVLLDRISRLDRVAILALWIRTDEGFDWLHEHHTDEDGLERVSMDQDAVVAYLRGLLLQTAADEDNGRVKKYLGPMDEEPSEDNTWRLFDHIVSGGQTGADRAALDFAIEYGYRHGGWTPQGREAEDGPIPVKYQLTELTEGGYRQRTKRNVEDSDATLIINIGELDGGTLATQTFAQKLGRPCFLAQLDTDTLDGLAARITAWLRDGDIQKLNVAGPRESKRPGIYLVTRKLLEAVDAANRPARHP